MNVINLFVGIAFVLMFPFAMISVGFNVAKAFIEFHLECVPK